MVCRPEVKPSFAVFRLQNYNIFLHLTVNRSYLTWFSAHITVLGIIEPYECLKQPIEQIYEGGNSKARNPRIQNMLRMVGFGENIGSGFPKIIAAWKETNWGKPELKNKIELDEVELVLPVPTIGQRRENGSFVPSNDPKDDPKG